jgi:erythromycin esterase-like protein
MLRFARALAIGALSLSCSSPWLSGCGSSSDDEPSGASTGIGETSPPPMLDTAVAENGVYTLAGFAPELPPDDLAPIAASLRDADVVGLGESAHGSAGFLGVKVRISRELIEHHGFRVVTWESHRVPARRLQQYVATCAGDAGEAVKSLIPIWADMQTRDFAGWLCRWNQAHPDDPVQVHGFDVQDPAADAEELKAFVTAAAPAQADWLVTGLSMCDTKFRTTSSDDDHARCLAGIAAFRAFLDLQADALAKSGTPVGLATAYIALTSLAAWQDEWLIADPATSFEARDVGMAKVFEQLRALHFPGEKALIWAHNIHVVKRHESVRYSWVGGPIVTQGTQLERDLGEGHYRSLAIIGLNVAINRDGYVGPVPTPPSPESVEVLLQGGARPALFADLHHPNIGRVLTPGTAYEMGAPGAERNVPAESYDGVLYLEDSPPATLVP